MIILGIDPGVTRVGYGIIEVQRSSLRFIEAGLLRVTEKEKQKQFLQIHEDLARIIRSFSPDRAALETIFFSKNKKTAIDVSHARGIIALTLALHNVPLFEYGPPQIKKAITGSGSADKQSLLRVIEKILRIEFEGEHDDVSDAIAIALTAAFDAR